MRLDLLPIFQNENGLRTYLQTNFRRLEDALKSTPKFTSGVASVTGSGTVATGLTVVTNCYACFSDDPSPDAFVLGVAPSGTDIVIRVFKLNWPTGAGSTFLLSTVAKNIRWVALGE